MNSRADDNSPSPISSRGKPGRSRSLFLTSLFVASFLVPVALLVIYRQQFVGNPSEQLTEEKEISDSIGIRGSGYYVSIPNDPSLEVQSGKDFLLTVWFKLNSLPRSNQKIFVALKYDKSAKHSPGYAISLTRDGERLRPAIYWKDATGAGRWYDFAPWLAAPRTWHMLALSFSNGEFLGLHAISGTRSESAISLLGGYDLDPAIVPISQSDLRFGSVGAAEQWQGRLGAVGIFQTPRLQEKLALILKSFSENPEEIPSIFESEEVGLWWEAHGAEKNKPGNITVHPEARTAVSR